MRKVLVVEGTAVFEKLLEKIIGGIEGFEICANAHDAFEATALIKKTRPDLIISDVELPGVDGVHFLRKLIPQYAVPVIICTSHKNRARAALEAGAADFIIKPNDANFDGFALTLTAAVKNAVNLREITCDGVTYRLRRAWDKGRFDNRLVLIGGSAGSTDALPVILREFTSDMPPVAVTIHMPDGYTRLYASRLNKELDINVSEAQDGKRLKNGSAVIAHGARHMRICRDDEGFYVSSKTGARISGHCPSVDAMFDSATKLKNTKILAVLLTGMGFDGAKGLLKLKKTGAYTIGQDEESCLVYGMPKEALKLGALCRQCALEDIATEIKRKINDW